MSKFPHSPQLALLLEIQAENPDSRLAEFLGLTLDQMARQGLRDHVHGGFFRYTVDPDWRTPHFEKMLYDNAQLAMRGFASLGMVEHFMIGSVMIW